MAKIKIKKNPYQYILLLLVVIICLAQGINNQSQSSLTKDYVKQECNEQIITMQEMCDTIKMHHQDLKQYVGEFKITAYCPCAKCCGRANGKCANGEYPIEGITIAADTRKFPLGTKLYIEGIGERIVMDTGSAIKGNNLDLFISTHQECKTFGVRRNVKVWIIK